jgi:hypothetical protein
VKTLLEAAYLELADVTMACGSVGESITSELSRIAPAKPKQNSIPIRVSLSAFVFRSWAASRSIAALACIRINSVRFL